MQSRILFTSLTWSKSVWGKNHWLCNEEDATQFFNGYFFTTDKSKALTMPLREAESIASKISTRATVAIV